MKKTVSNLLALAGLTAAVFAPRAQAELLVHESFSGYSTTGGTGGTATLVGQTATGTGLTGTWALRASDKTHYTETGLSFGSLLTSGGAASFSLPGESEASVVGVEMNLASPVTGSLYSSMLFNFSSLDGDDGSLSGIRVSDDIGLQNNNRFSTYTDVQDTITYSPGVAYNDTSSNSGETLSLNTTYIAISIFENVGEVLGGGNPGEGNVYVLNLAQFEDFVANGRNEANLTGRTIGSLASQASATAAEPSNTSGDTFSFKDGDFMGFASYSKTGAGTVAGTYDELRWGTSLGDVTAVPEPSVYALFTGLLAALIRLRRRQRSV